MPDDLPAGPELDERLRQIERWQSATDESREGEDRDADYLLATKGIDWLKEMFAAERVARQAAEKERDELLSKGDALAQAVINLPPFDGCDPQFWRQCLAMAQDFPSPLPPAPETEKE